MLMMFELCMTPHRDLHLAVAAHRWHGRARLVEEPRAATQRQPRDRRHIAYPGVGRGYALRD